MTSSLSVHVNDDCGPPASSAKFELFHAPSFGDEDFELTSGAASYPSATRPDVISTGLSTSATILSSTTSPGVNEVTSGRLHASPTTTTGSEEMSSLHRPEASPCCNYGNVMPSGHPMIGMQPQGDAGSGYCLQQNSAPLMTSSQPSLQCSGIITSNNNNNNNNGNIDSSTVDFRALDRQSFTPPFVMTSFGRQYYDRSSQFPQAHHGYGYSNQQQQQQQQQQRQLASAYELTMMNDRNCETVHSQQQRHLQMQSVPDQIQIAAAMRCGLVPPSAANTAVGPHQNSPIALGSVCSENALDSGASGRLNPMAGFYQPRPEPCEDSSAVAKKPKSSKKRKKKDSNEPQKPVSAYALFFRDTQAAIKSHNPSASFGEMSKIVAAMWDSLDDLNKNIYRKRTEMAKKLYLKQLATYRASQLTKTDDVSSGQQTHVTSASPAVTPDTTTKSPGLTIGNVPSQQPQQQAAMVTGNGNPQQTSPLVHLSVDTGSRQMAQLPPPSYSLLTSSSLLTQQPTMTSRYRDAYGSVLMAGNNNNHLIHSTPTSSLYHHGLHVDTSMPPYPSAPAATAVGMAGNCNSQIGFGAVHSTTGHDEVRWNYYDVTHPPPKCDYPQASPAWWIR